jgi:hypothetical protein
MFSSFFDFVLMPVVRPLFWSLHVNIQFRHPMPQFLFQAQSTYVWLTLLAEHRYCLPVYPVVISIPAVQAPFLGLPRYWTKLLWQQLSVTGAMSEIRLAKALGSVQSLTIIRFRFRYALKILWCSKKNGIAGKPLPPLTKRSQFHTANNQHRSQPVNGSIHAPRSNGKYHLVSFFNV